MTKFWLNVLSGVLGTAIIANVAFLFRVESRLARLETQVQIVLAEKHTTTLTQK